MLDEHAEHGAHAGYMRHRERSESGNESEIPAATQGADKNQPSLLLGLCSVNVATEVTGQEGAPRCPHDDPQLAVGQVLDLGVESLEVALGIEGPVKELDGDEIGEVSVLREHAVPVRGTRGSQGCGCAGCADEAVNEDPCVLGRGGHCCLVHVTHGPGSTSVYGGHKTHHLSGKDFFGHDGTELSISYILIAQKTTKIKLYFDIGSLFLEFSSEADARSGILL
jgi:hypothetical protein